MHNFSIRFGSAPLSFLMIVAAALAVGIVMIGCAAYAAAKRAQAL